MFKFVLLTHIFIYREIFTLKKIEIFNIQILALCGHRTREISERVSIKNSD